MDNNGKSLKEVLESGVSREEMIKAFTEQIDKAESEIKAEAEKAEAETKKSDALDETRGTLASAFVDYAVATGLITEDEIDSMLEVVTEMLVECEKYVDLIRDIEETPVKEFLKIGGDSSDAIIKAFVKTL